MRRGMDPMLLGVVVVVLLPLTAPPSRSRGRRRIRLRERDGIRGMHDRDGRMMRRILILILMRNVLMRILVRRCRNVMKLLVLL